MANEVRLRLTGETFEVGLGDLSAVYSNYTFNNAFFGASATLRPTRGLTLSALGGINRWPKTDTYGRAFGGAPQSRSPPRPASRSRQTTSIPRSPTSTPALP